jgi:hypothetical protein
MPDCLTVSDAAREFTAALGQEVKPRDISTLFYQRALRDDLCPIVGGRRLIPADYLPQIEAALRRAGKIRPREATPR